MDVFHHDLETIKAAGFRQLYLAHEIHCQVFIYNTITGGKKCKYVRYKMTLAIIEAVPVFEIIAQVYLLGGPETGFMFFIFFPDEGIIDWEDDKAVFVF